MPPFMLLPSRAKTSSTDTIRISKYDSQGDVVYRFIIVPVPESNGLFRTLLRGDGSVDASDDTFYSVRSVVAVQIDAAQEIIDTLEMVFLWIGVVVAIFAMLLLFNFISVSITHKKKEIGILRAVGARSTDVFKIFYAESAIITIILKIRLRIPNTRPALTMRRRSDLETATMN